MMQLIGFRKTFGRTIAADSVSFVAPDGSVTGLLGPNGAGKTTTLRALTGLARPDAGQVLVDGIDVVSDATSARKRLGVLPETVGLYERLTVREHLWYAGALHALGATALRERVADLIARFDLQEIADRRAGTLSFGQRRRVALARALVSEPQNVILDEPTSGLDVMTIRQVRHEIRRLAALGRAVIVSSHVMPEVATTCDRIVVLARGSVLAEGTPAEMLARTGCATLEDAFVHLIGSDRGLN